MSNLTVICLEIEREEVGGLWWTIHLSGCWRGGLDVEGMLTVNVHGYCGYKGMAYGQRRWEMFEDNVGEEQKKQSYEEHGRDHLIFVTLTGPSL